MLLFKQKFLPAIRSGEKTQTIRFWNVCRMRSGQRSYIPGVGYIHVTAVDRVEIAELTDADARPDGFANAAALRQELATLYAGLDERYQAYRIVFRVLPADEQQAARAERKRRMAK